MMSLCPLPSGESAPSLIGCGSAAEGGVYPAVLQKQPVAALSEARPHRLAGRRHAPSSPVRPGVRDAAIGPQPERGGA